MKTAGYKKALTAFIGLCAFITTLGQQPDSLAHYLEIASKNNPLVLQKYYEYQTALQKILQAGSLPDPELSMGIFLTPMEIVSGKQAADIRLMQMFPWFGVLKNAKDEMSLMANARFESLRDTRLQVWFDVQRTWYELLKTSQNIGIAEKNIQILKSIERLALTKFSTGSESGAGTSITSMNSGNTMQNNYNTTASPGMPGMTSAPAVNATPPLSAMPGSNDMSASAPKPGLIDVIRVQIEIGDIKNNIALLESRLQTQSAKFNGYLNRPANTPVILPDSIRPDTLSFQLLLLNDSVLAKNPMPGMWLNEQQALVARERMVARMGFPMVGIGLNYSVIQKSSMSASDMSGNNMLMPMITFTLPVYRKKYKAMQNEAGLMQAAAVQGYQSAVNELQNEYYEAIQLYHDAQRRMELYAQQNKLATQSYDIMTKSFSASGTGLSDLLRYRQLLLDYENRQVEAVADYNTAVAWLKKIRADVPLYEFKALE
ncbi:MAG: TolC family protein [Bacteroidales bacterium]|nr:TolC family protein [Bacteroidales bacterium]